MKTISINAAPRARTPFWAGALFACALSACGTDPQLRASDTDTYGWTGMLTGVDGDLALGARGEQTRALNRYLTEIGYFPSEALAWAWPAWRPVVAAAPADESLFDEQTQEAVRRYQEARGLPVTGIADDETRAVMARPRFPRPDGIPRADATDKFSVANNGMGRRNLTFKIAGGTGTLTPSQVQQAITAATAAWAAQGSGLSFSQIFSGNANVLFQFVKPPLPVPTWLNGQTISLDPNAPWTMTQGSALDLQQNAQHMLGFVLGFNESSFPNAQMAVGTPPTRDFALDDRYAASALYDTYVVADPNFGARDIAVGAFGDTWAISNVATADGSGNFRIARREVGNVFRIITEGLGGVRIAVEPSGTPWIVQASGNILRKNDNSSAAVGWTLMPDQARDIGIGGTSGMGHVWIAGKAPVNGGGQVKKFNGSAFIGSNGGANKLSVTNDGIPWLVAASGAVFRHTNADPLSGSWEQLSGNLTDIGVGPLQPSIGGNPRIALAWSVAINGSFQQNLSPWAEQPSPLAKGWLSGFVVSPNGGGAVAVKPDGHPIIVDGIGRVWESTR
jgi:peptidoglycan hydrolase-like protein with peptidoglycan-binding domain